MDFLMSDVTAITEVSRDRCEKWMQEGYIIPSVQRASGRGTRNVFSIIDLYLIELFKHMTKAGTGWPRKVAAGFLRAIDQDQIAEVSKYMVMSEMLIATTVSKTSDLFEQIHEAYRNADKEKAWSLADEKQKYDELLANERGIRVFIVFIRKWVRGPKIFCTPLITGVKKDSLAVIAAEITGLKQSSLMDVPLEVADTWETIQHYLFDAENFYSVNFTSLVEKVHMQIDLLYPLMGEDPYCPPPQREKGEYHTYDRGRLTDKTAREIKEKYDGIKYSE